jgi:hypothetical protein
MTEELIYMDENGTLHNLSEELRMELQKQYRAYLREWTEGFKNDRNVRKIFNEKLEELEAERFDEQVYRDKMYRTTVNLEEWIREWLLDSSKVREEKIISQIKKFSFYRNQCNKHNAECAELNINLAKEYLIGDLIPASCKPKGGRMSGAGKEFYHCPLHSDKTPSFCWYKKNNSWYCFSCQQGGDVISLYQKMNKATFVEAVKNLVC